MKESHAIMIQNKPLKCHHCENDKFYEFGVAMNKKWLSAFDLELFSKKGIAYICDQCGYKHEFYSK